MIRTEKEYNLAKQRLKGGDDRLDAMRDQLELEGLGKNEIKRAMDPVVTFQRQLEEEIEAYEGLKRGVFPEIENLQGLGELLISLRVYNQLSQRALAGLLGIHESQVSRDEHNEYHGITVGRAEKILKVMGATLRSRVEVAS